MGITGLPKRMASRTSSSTPIESTGTPLSSALLPDHHRTNTSNHVLTVTSEDCGPLSRQRVTRKDDQHTLCRLHLLAFINSAKRPQDGLLRNAHAKT